MIYVFDAYDYALDLYCETLCHMTDDEIEQLCLCNNENEAQYLLLSLSDRC